MRKTRKSVWVFEAFGVFHVFRMGTRGFPCFPHFAYGYERFSVFFHAFHMGIVVGHTIDPQTGTGGKIQASACSVSGKGQE